MLQQPILPMLMMVKVKEVVVVEKEDKAEETVTEEIKEEIMAMDLINTEVDEEDMDTMVIIMFRIMMVMVMVKDGLINQ